MWKHLTHEHERLHFYNHGRQTLDHTLSDENNVYDIILIIPVFLSSKVASVKDKKIK